MRKSGRLALSLLGALCGIAALVTLTPRPAAAAIDTSASEQRFYDLLNAARGTHGLGGLQPDPGLARVALNWSSRMSGANNLSHRPDLIAAIGTVDASWQGAGENVGFSSDPNLNTQAITDGLHTKFMNSPEHYANIIGDYNRVGVGVIESNGKVWVTVNFLKGASLAVAASEAPARTWAASGYEPLNPVRLVDTRQTGAVAAGGTLSINPASAAPAAASAEAVAINVTVTGATNSGFLTVYPCGSSVPNASNLNYEAGETRAVLVTVALGGGAFCVYSQSRAHIIADIQGAYRPGAGARYQAQSPSRLLDTRSGGAVTSARINLPRGTAAAALNVTALSNGGGFVTAYPCDVALPNTSNVNTAGGTPVANLVMARVAGNGQICLNASSPMHLIVDLQGVYGGGGSLTAASEPRRALDTRNGTGGRITKSSPNPAEPIVIDLRGSGRVPGNAQGALLTATVTGTAGDGWLTVYPCDAGLPQASNLNFGSGQTVANSVLAKLDGSGRVCIATSARADVIIDVAGALVS
jgi:uncharacterized protein YkwD